MDSLLHAPPRAVLHFIGNDVTQPNPDTLLVNMVEVNEFGCTDTAISKRLIIFPEVHAVFSLSDL
jgi:hypothetical protein